MRDSFSKPSSFGEVLKKLDEIEEERRFIRQLMNLEVRTGGGAVRRIQRTPRSINAILDLGTLTSAISTSQITTTNYDPETILWISRATAGGGTFLANSKKVADDFIRELHLKSYNSKIKWLNPFLGGNVATALVPLRDFVSAGAATNHGFSDSNFTQVGGLVGNGVAWADINFKPSALGTNSNGGFGFVSGGGSPTSWLIGMTNGTTQIFGVRLDATHELLYWGDATSATDTGSPGGAYNYYGQRASDTNRKLFKNGTIIATDTDSGAAVGALGFANAGLFSINSGGEISPGIAQCAYATDGTLTDDEAADLSLFIQTKLIAKKSSSGDVGQTFPDPAHPENQDETDGEELINSIVVDDVTGEVLTDDVTHNVLTNT